MGEPKVRQTLNSNTLLYRFDSEDATPAILRLKIEINCREHFTILGYQERNFNVRTRWFSGSEKIQTYQLEELLGTKLRALYQRKKGRDLYDLYKASISSEPNLHEIIFCYKEYMKASNVKCPTSKQFTNNLTKKLRDKAFLNDTAFLLTPLEKYYPQQVFQVISKEIINML